MTHIFISKKESTTYQLCLRKGWMNGPLSTILYFIKIAQYLFCHLSYVKLSHSIYSRVYHSFVLESSYYTITTVILINQISYFTRFDVYTTSTINY